MTDAGTPPSVTDPERLAALRRLDLTRDHSEAFDRLARLAAEYLDAPIALVSIVEEDRQIFLGSVGLPEETAASGETPLRFSYCQYLVESREPLIVDDARDSPLLCTHPALHELGMIAYIGIPITTSGGHVLGSFCALDTSPRHWTSRQASFLEALAGSVMTEIELRSELIERRAAEAKLTATEAHYRRLATNIPQGVYVLDVEGRFTEMNASTEQILQRSAPTLLGESFLTVIPESTRPAAAEIFEEVISGTRDNVESETRIRQADGNERLLMVTATAIRRHGRIEGIHGIARDITEERARDRHVRESEERFRLIAENVRDVFWIFTPDFSRTIYISPQYQTVTGLPVEQIYADAQSFLTVVHDEDRGRLMNAMEQIAHTSVTGVEYRVIHPDGEVRWVLSRGYPARDERGEVVYVVGTSEDITSRKVAEKIVVESEARLRQILEALPIGAVLAEPPGRLAWHNEVADRIWGGLRPADPDSHDRYSARWTESGRPLGELDWPLARALAGQVVTGELIDIDAFDGVCRTTLNSAVPLRGSNGRVTGALQVMDDVTESRARQGQQMLLAAALEGLSEGICLFTTEGEIVYANETYMRILGIDAARIPGLRFSEFAENPETAQAQRDAMATAAEHGRWSGRITRRRLTDGVEVPIDIVMGRVETPGAGKPGTGAALLFGIAHDATADIELEQQLRRAERLASVGTLIGGVAHELNNPLQAILNFSQLLLLEERSGEDHEALTIVEREAQRMAGIVADLKQIARSTQESAPGGASSDLNEVVSHVLKVQEYRLRTSNIEVKLDLAPGLPLVQVDRGQLEQVVTNLVVNAEQAMSGRPDGRLIVRTRASADGACLHVVDNGHGIPGHNLQRIFDPFFTTKAPGGGTGLGLSLVHSIVTENGGDIRVESQVGTGTAFRLDWRRAADPPQPPATRAQAELPSKALDVLIVDDEASVRTVMVRYLERRGHRVHEAGDGGAALALLDSNSYDVILSDIRMPGLGGEALLEELEERGLAGKVVFMTGDAAGAAARLEQAGVPVLIKPVQLTEVASAIETNAERTSES